MDVFEFRDQIIHEYENYVRSFLTIKDQRIDRLVSDEMNSGLLWPDPLIQLNPSFERGESLRKLIDDGELHPECLNIFRAKGSDGTIGEPFRLHRHQVDGVRAARAGENYVLTTGTGSGKSLAYIVPIVDHVLRRGSGKGIQAIIVYPMNALANSQIGELEKFLHRGYEASGAPVTFRRYTGQESDEERKEIIAKPPDILLTNYVMLELVLTRPWDHQLIDHAEGLRFLVLDELHTYRGRQGADVAMLCRRLAEACKAPDLLHVGTSATLAGGGSWSEQQAEVAASASQLFGAGVETANIIGETLRRATREYPDDDVAFVARLRDRLESASGPQSGDTEMFLDDPLSSWIESTLGLQREAGSERIVRSTPRSLTGQGGAAEMLSELTGVGTESCERQLREHLLAGYRCHDENGRPLFAFRLHQFVSKGEAVFASPESEEARYITLQAQQYAPGTDRSKVLLPLAFCRECGQEYYSVRRGRDEDGNSVFFPRAVADRFADDNGEAGYLYISSDSPWPDSTDEFVERLPDAWVDAKDGHPVVNRNQRKNLPRKIFLSKAGVENDGNDVAWWLDAPFRFCMSCGVAYGAHQQSDFGKLTTLGSEGRSTATTIMSLSAIRRLQRDDELESGARKLLSFTDNRQDASLQAGHFNDFIEVSLLRAALWRAVERAGEEGVRHDKLTLRIFETLELPLRLYSADPSVKYAARDETDRALREALGYYIYRDLRRGWRITSPNLEQCGLLRIDYLSLGEFCADQEEWKLCHPVLCNATAGTREAVCRTLLDFLRRELAIRVNYLDPVEQESIRQLSGQRLISPWALDDNEQLERSRIVFPTARSGGADGTGHFVHISPRGGLGQYLKRNGTFPDWKEKLGMEDVAQIIAQLCERLAIPGLIHRVLDPRNDGDVPGYQLNASAMIWRAGTGSAGFHDPIRVPRKPDDGLRTNPFFTEFYQENTSDLKELEAREHTAQVPGEIRERREEKFRNAELPILYCSPTMELGVDISQLNVVNMRNVPPTPANYAQRSGRAGRSGQPAFVFSYCTTGSPHDQYFFKRPNQMVAGAVSTPRLDLGNEDLVRAHVHAIWLGTAKLTLGGSLREVLDVSGDEPTLEVLPNVAAVLNQSSFRERARERALASLGGSIADLVGNEGKPEEWLDRVLQQIPKRFENACGRWRGLYSAALSQSKRQQRIVLDPSRDPRDRESAKRLRAEAEAQLRLLLETSQSRHSDFNSYRYFASEGFLPGYNFPRLPLSAFLPGRQRKKGTDEFLTRPRFLAITEFGPRGIIYHEGSRYVINKVILPIDSEQTSVKRRAAQCKECGYLHPLGDEPGPDLCESCRAQLPPTLDNLFRMENVATRRRDRINSDEEERLRLGYELKTGVRFAQRGGVVSARSAEVIAEDGELLATLIYGHAATLWRMNLGWSQRKDKGQTGYVLDVERGFWAKSQTLEDDPEDPLSPQTERVVPYVEDTRNCILIHPEGKLTRAQMASLESAINAAIQASFQLEDRELATEALPDANNRQRLLFYEASEGGAGVLRRLVEDPTALGKIARTALEIAHFDPESGVDHQHAAGAREACEAACYDCLLSYFNQRDHRLVDRHLLPELLAPWLTATVKSSPAPEGRDEQVTRLLNLCESDLERRWLHEIDQMGLSLPSHAQRLIEECSVRPDFLYEREAVAVFIDGPHHDAVDQKAKDAEQQDRLEDHGYSVIRFHHAADWQATIRNYSSLFGTPSAEVSGTTAARPSTETAAYDPEDFDEEWRELLGTLATKAGVSVAPAEEVMVQGRVVDLDLATITIGDRSLHLVDDAKDSAAAVASALDEQGNRVLRVRFEEPGLVARILEALRG